MATNFTDVITNRQVELSFTPPQNYFLTCERLPKVVFTVQSFTIPTINGGESVLPNSLNPTRMYVPGDGIVAALEVQAVSIEGWADGGFEMEHQIFLSRYIFHLRRRHGFDKRHHG